MGRIKELINRFLEPNEIKRKFSELAIASGVSLENVEELNNTKNGISWKEFEREDEEKTQPIITSQEGTNNQIETSIDQAKNEEIIIDNEQER